LGIGPAAVFSRERRPVSRFPTPSSAQVSRLISVKADGTRRLCQIDTRGIEVLRRWLQGFWDERLGAFKKAAEQAVTKARKSR
jgi:hypothetical protein